MRNLIKRCWWILIPITFGFLLFTFSCRTIYVDRPYYVTQNDSIQLIDTAILIHHDTIKSTVVVPIKNKLAIIDTKFLFSKAWIFNDSLFLSANLKNNVDTVKIKNTIRTITNTPAPIIITKTEKVYTHSDRFLENWMYGSGWVLWGIILLAAITFIIKFLIKIKIL